MALWEDRLVALSFAKELTEISGTSQRTSADNSVP